jgi:hypothetical protein
MSKKRSGAYLLTVGPFLYVGSSWDVDRRRSSHVSDLRSGIHQNPKLQAAWNQFPESAHCSVITPVTPLPNESPNELRARLRSAEQDLLNFYKANPKLTNTSLNALGPDNSQSMKAKWQNPLYRAKMAAALANRPKPSPEARAKMSSAKQGSKNHKSKPVHVRFFPTRAIQTFPSATAAAKHLGVSQQLFDSWLKGTVPTPGNGIRTKLKHLIGISVSYV